VRTAAALLLAISVLVFVTPSIYADAPVVKSQDDKSGFEDRPPEGLFQQIVTALGEEMVMGQFRSFQIVPVKPTEVFTTEDPEIFVVFKVHPHYNAYQVFGRWMVERGEGVPANHILGTDTMYLALEDESGYVSLKRPSTGWPVGDYKVEIHIGHKISDISQVGTLRFKVLPPKAAS
jgi:hypothetical protein